MALHTPGNVISVFGNVDEILTKFGVTHTFIESGRISILNKLDEAYDDGNSEQYQRDSQCTHWCELSWDNEELEIEMAFNEFAMGAGAAIEACLRSFIRAVQSDTHCAKRTAIKLGIYEMIMQYV